MGKRLSLDALRRLDGTGGGRGWKDRTSLVRGGLTIKKGSPLLAKVVQVDKKPVRAKVSMAGGLATWVPNIPEDLEIGQDIVVQIDRIEEHSSSGDIRLTASFVRIAPAQPSPGASAPQRSPRQTPPPQFLNARFIQQRPGTLEVEVAPGRFEEGFYLDPLLRLNGDDLAGEFKVVRTGLRAPYAGPRELCCSREFFEMAEQLLDMIKKETPEVFSVHEWDFAELQAGQSFFVHVGDDLVEFGGRRTLKAVFARSVPFDDYCGDSGEVKFSLRVQGITQSSSVFDLIDAVFLSGKKLEAVFVGEPKFEPARVVSPAPYFKHQVSPAEPRIETGEVSGSYGGGSGGGAFLRIGNERNLCLPDEFSVTSLSGGNEIQVVRTTVRRTLGTISSIVCVEAKFLDVAKEAQRAIVERREFYRATYRELSRGEINLKSSGKAWLVAANSRLDAYRYRPSAVYVGDRVAFWEFRLGLETFDPDMSLMDFVNTWVRYNYLLAVPI